MNNTLCCIECGSKDIESVDKAEYNEIKVENCFILYHENKVACVCDADKKEVVFEED